MRAKISPMVNWLTDKSVSHLQKFSDWSKMSDFYATYQDGFYLDILYWGENWLFCPQFPGYREFSYPYLVHWLLAFNLLMIFSTDYCDH